MKDLFVEPSHAIPLVSLVVALRSGNAEDPPAKGGLARLTARMVRRGAKGLDSRAIEDTLDRLGSELAVDTSASSVANHASVIGRSLDGFVDLLAKLFAEPTFPEEELGRLKRETIAELGEIKDSDRGLAQRAFRRAMFPDHPYGRGGAGTTTSVESITRDDVLGFFRKHFVRDNVVVGLSGDVTEAKGAEIAGRLKGALPAGAAIPDAVPEPPFPKGRRLVFVDKPDRTQTQILIGTRGTLPHDPDHVALGVATAIFGGTFTSRLMREVRSKRGWSYGASARAAIDRHRQAFSMWTFPAATDAAACIALELQLYEALVKDGVTPRETSFIRRYLTRSHAFEVDTAAKRLHQKLDVEILKLPADYYSGYLEHVHAVTPETASAAVANRLALDDLLVVVVGTAKDILPAVEKAIPGLTSTDVVPFDGG